MIRKIIFVSIHLLCMAIPVVLYGQKRISVFNDAKVFKYTKPINDQKSWYQYKVTKGQGMFNPVYLPFEYEAKDVKAEMNQRITFPSLLSFKFDFVPDNYNARHPAFVYRRDTDALSLSSHELERIKQYIRNWNATHAIGGKLVQEKNGYTGKLLVFDTEAQIILEQNYSKPCAYFELMGKMVQSWMTFRQQTISPGLLEQLLLPMTGKMETVTIYGTSFYEEWRTQAEWDLYEKILDIDPGFGEVRYWYANQKGWKIGFDKAEIVNNCGKSLNNHIVVPALREFDYSDCKDKTVQEQYMKQLSLAEKIMPENPSVLYTLLKIKDVKNTDKLKEYLPMAARFPSSFLLIDELGDRFMNLGLYDYAIPLKLSAVNSGYLPGTGGFAWAYADLCSMFSVLDFPFEAMTYGMQSLDEDGDENANLYAFRYLAQALASNFDFETASLMYLKVFHEKKEDSNLLFGLLCAFASGDMSNWQSYKKEYLKGIIPARIEPFVNAIERIAAGKSAEGIQILDEKISVKKGFTNAEIFESDLLRADVALMNSDYKTAQIVLARTFGAFPISRRLYFLLNLAFPDDIALLGRITEVLLFISEGDEYYTQCLQKLMKKGYVPVSENTPPDEEEKTMPQYDKERSGFNPFAVEYNFIRMKRGLADSGDAWPYTAEELKTNTGYSKIFDLSGLMKDIFIALLVNGD